MSTLNDHDLITKEEGMILDMLLCYVEDAECEDEQGP